MAGSACCGRRTSADPRHEGKSWISGSVVAPATTRSDQRLKPMKAQIESLQGQDLRRGPFAKQIPWGGDPYPMPRARRLRYWAMCKAAARFVTTPTSTRRVEDAQVIELGVASGWRITPPVTRSIVSFSTTRRAE
jgi:hypothetical protein